MNFIDRFQTTLASGYTSGGSSLSLTSASGLPSGACDFFLVVKAEGGNTEEVFRVSNVSGTTLTVTGAQANTSASNHGSGATVEAGIITATVLSSFSSGALVLLDAQTASSSSEIDFVSDISATYDEYMLELVNVITANVNATVVIEMSTDNGSTYDQTSGHYAWSQASFDLMNTSSNGSDVALTILHSTGNPSRVNGSVKLYAPGGSTAVKTVMGQMSGSDIGWNVWGKWTQTSAYNAFRLRSPSGNFTSGNFRLYGLAKS